MYVELPNVPSTRHDAPCDTVAAPEICASAMKETIAATASVVLKKRFQSRSVVSIAPTTRK